MNETKILSGIASSRLVYESLKSRIFHLKEKKITPSLAAVLIGNNPASEIYIRSKQEKFASLNIIAETFRLKSDSREDDLICLIEELNIDVNYHGILIQLPLPNHINTQRILSSINPDKDVDGFHPENIGLLTSGNPRFIPCTPKGIMKIFEYEKITLENKHIVVLGRSNIVGRPISILTSLKGEMANATTTICHSGTLNIEKYTQLADILILAIGIPNFINGTMLKKGSVIIDVGINRINKKTAGNPLIVGDADWESLMGIASAATPVPGGVGPMTIAMLLENTVEAAEKLIS